jgi:hypothetical protein
MGRSAPPSRSGVTLVTGWHTTRRPSDARTGNSKVHVQFESGALAFGVLEAGSTAAKKLGSRTIGIP